MIRCPTGRLTTGFRAAEASGTPATLTPMVTPIASTSVMIARRAGYVPSGCLRPRANGIGKRPGPAVGRGQGARSAGYRFIRALPTGKTARPLIPFITPAAEVYQATRAVMMPI